MSMIAFTLLAIGLTTVVSIVLIVAYVRYDHRKKKKKAT
jgi:hypothetical protein